VTALLSRLASGLGRLAQAAATPPCPDCRAPMALRREDPVGPEPVTLERVYECRACGTRVSRYCTWAIPD
jgi:hypothetical protein